MKKVLSIFLFILFFLPFQREVIAQSTLSGSLKTEVVGQVGEFYLNLSGSASSFASIALSFGDSFVASTVAETNGNFFIKNVLIKRGLSGFCLTVVDFKRVGESTTCFSFPPAIDSITMDDLFLPPTLGLSSTTLEFNSTVLAFGYTLPGSKVTLFISNEEPLVTVADSKGYYSFEITKLSPGSYDLYTKAESEGKESLVPTKKTQLKSIFLAQKPSGALKDVGEGVKSIFTSSYFWFILLVLAIFILIIILIKKLMSRLRSGGKSFLHQEVPTPAPEKKMLHHWWWVGF